ncbi:aconitase [Melghirimyces thermohalophilus]|uniref:aconitate hydratase n=2 Tax=Melghirimyces thermohalophilus TaxID=1236220 RepID=A0A1G6NM05_9BACL|nr:aconitase [Melghirimyces thermohalophilus]
MMARNVTQKLIGDHLVSGEMKTGEEIGIRIDQTLTQDATGTLVMLELEAMGLDRVKTEISAQYVDHNLLQEDHKNADDHLFLQSAAQRFGLWFSRPGNGVSHPVHMQHLGKPGKTMVGSDSHTCANGSLGMLAIGSGGLEVAMAMAGEPFYIKMPEVWGVRLTGKLPEWVSAKDVILEMLRRYGVSGGVGKVFEYHGPGLDSLSAMDRHVIANMGAELGCTTTVFPSDDEVRRFLYRQGREADWVSLLPDEGAEYDRVVELDLTQLEPLIALPDSPGNVVPVREVAGRPVYQSYIGSSANPGYRDFAIAAKMVKGRQVVDTVSFDINPTSRQLLENLMQEGLLFDLIQSGARLHQAGCNGCIGMGQAPATGRNSLRTVPRNFPGRSGTVEDSVYLCSPETATASALTGKITDPRDLDMDYPVLDEPKKPVINTQMLMEPPSPEESRKVQLVKGPNISTIHELEPLADPLEVEVLLKVGDDISTDEILPAGAHVLPFRSNIPRISEFAFGIVDDSYAKRAMETYDQGRRHAVVGGENYGQGSSREHAALAPQYLGLRLVVAKSFARIHWQNLINFGVLPLTFDDPEGYDQLEQGDVLILPHLQKSIEQGRKLTAEVKGRNQTVALKHDLSPRQIDVIQAGGLINWVRQRQ